jgi:hypothetical protein
MKCAICIEWCVDRDSVWVTGNQSFSRALSIIIIPISKSHKQAISSRVDSLNFKKLEAKLVDQTDTQIIKLMRISYYLARENIALLKYESILELCRDLKVEINLGTYKSRYGCNELLRVLSDYIEEENMKRLKGAESFSIMIDEATDVNMKANLIIYACLSSCQILLQIIDFVFQISICTRKRCCCSSSPRQTIG